MKNSSIYVSLETTAFSGATLLALMLGSHPTITTVGELSGLIPRSDPDTYLCSCGEKIKHCQFWKSVTFAMGRKGYSFDTAHFDTRFDFAGPNFFRRLREGSVRNSWIDALRDKVLFSLPGERNMIRAKAERNAALIDSILEVTGEKVFVDSSKCRMRIRALRQFSTLDVRAIHLTRRVEGVVASQLRRNPGMAAVQPARDWHRRHRRLDSTLQSWMQEKYIQVRYEDICLDPENTLKRLFRFCNLSTDYQKIQSDTNNLHIIGNPMRLNPRLELLMDERWRTELSKHQLNEIYRVAGKLNRQFGYH